MFQELRVAGYTGGDHRDRWRDPQDHQQSLTAGTGTVQHTNVPLPRNAASFSAAQYGFRPPAFGNSMHINVDVLKKVEMFVAFSQLAREDFVSLIKN